MAPREYFLPFGHHICSFFAFAAGAASLVHVVNIKLLRILDLPINWLTNGEDIGVHVLARYLAVTVRRMPASIGRFANLEFLIVNAMAGTFLIPPMILKLVKLRYLHVTLEVRFDKGCCKNLQMNNIESLFTIQVHNQRDEEVLKCSPNLRKLKCKCGFYLDEQGTYRHPDLHFLSQLESLKLISIFSLILLYGFGLSAGVNQRVGWIKFPLSIKRVNLSGSCLLWEKVSIIEGLPNLEVVKLEYQHFVRERWDTRDGEFQQLRILKIYQSYLVQYNVASSKHFPKLQQLMLHRCIDLQEISCEIGEIVTLQLIEVKSGKQSLRESAFRIQEEQRDMGNEELTVIILEDTL